MGKNTSRLASLHEPNLYGTQLVVIVVIDKSFRNDNEVDDNFPGETLMENNTKDEPFADFANYLLADIIPKGMTKGIVKDKCSICGFKWHPLEKCWEKVRYPPWHAKFKGSQQVRQTRKVQTQGRKFRSSLEDILRSNTTKIEYLYTSRVEIQEKKKNQAQSANVRRTFPIEITQEVLNATAGGIFLYKTPNQAYQLLEDKVLLKLDWAKNQKTKLSLKKTVAFANEGSINSDTNKIMARMDAMTMKIDAQYNELQSHAKKPKSDLDEDDMPMSREEEGLITATETRIQHNWLSRLNNIDVIDEILEEDFDALLDEGSKIHHSIEGTLLEEGIFAEFDEFMAMTADENSNSESDTEELPFEKITINTDYKIKTSPRRTRLEHSTQTPSR
ncbi:hypothetical protein Tco_0842245 [Tanacetum coccineum]|uniref:Reverse transcriptase domain-containing protein n=1 Tax=Tanacetum coccineum TaxID=301880 RepID=A0ABQ5B210_9ASTR